MEQRGDLLIFPYPGGEISFHKDLIDYFHIRNMIYNCTPGLTMTTRYPDPQKCLDKLTQELISFIRKTILPSLHEKKIYNVVEDDFIKGNPAYVEMFSSTQNFKRREENAITQSAYEVQAKKDLAYNEAQSTITGLGYTLYSNSIVDHAIYASKSEEAIKKQAWKAQERYDKAAKDIEAAGKQKLDNVISAGRQSYRSGLEKNIPALLEHMISVYCKKLAANGQFNSSCLVGIDEARSNAILENLQIAGAEKEGLIYSAIQLCPYNVNAFQAAYDTMDITAVPCFKEILSCFRMTKNFCAWLKSDRQEINSEAQVFYVRSKKLVKTISFLEETPEINVAHDLLSGKFNSDLSLYNEFATKIRSKAPLKKFVEKLCGISLEKELENSTNALGVYLLDQHLPQKCVDFYTEMGFDVFGTLSMIFDKEVTSFQDADNFISAVWKREVEGILDSQRVQEWIKEREELQEKLSDCSPGADLLLGILFSPCMVGLGVFMDFSFFNLCAALVLIPLGLCGLLMLLRFPVKIQQKLEYERKIEELNKLLKN